MPVVQNQHVVTAKWIFGQDAFSTRNYVVHTEYPAFLAKIGQDGEGVLALLSYAANDGRDFYDFVWFDPYPGEIQFLSLMREAEEAFEVHLIS